MEQSMTFSQNIDALFSNLEEFTRNESILGKPVTYEGKTLVPVISVMVGYGSGNTPSKNQQGTTGAAGMAQGMGALGLGARISTEAIVIIDNNNVSMLAINGKANQGLMDKLPQMLSSMNLGGGQQQNQNQQGQGQGQQGQQ